MVEVEIVPAILPRSAADLENHLEKIRDSVPLVQIDVVDGIFAPTKTWPYVGGDEFERIVAQDEGLPFWEDFDFQFDLMVDDAAKQAERFVQAGAAGIVIHAAAGARGALEALQESRGGVSLGLALLPGATVDQLQMFDGLYDFVQVMGIAEVGSQGNPFDERTLALVTALRAAYPAVLIQIDGGVSLSNASALVQVGANRLVVGSSIFKTDDPLEAYKKLYTEVNA